MEARGSGCVLLVSEASGAICKHGENALVHRVGDVDALAKHINVIHRDRAVLERLRATSLKTVHEITWKAAGVRLLDVYRETIETGPKAQSRLAADDIARGEGLPRTDTTRIATMSRIHRA